MEDKLIVIKGLILAIIITCVMIIWVNITLKAEAQEVNDVEVYKPIVVSPNDPTTLPWEDNFDTSYIEPITGCLYLTRK
jgi:hypothetical protein